MTRYDSIFDSGEVYKLRRKHHGKKKHEQGHRLNYVFVSLIYISLRSVVQIPERVQLSNTMAQEHINLSRPSHMNCYKTSRPRETSSMVRISKDLHRSSH